MGWDGVEWGVRSSGVGCDPRSKPLGESGSMPPLGNFVKMHFARFEGSMM